MRLSELHGSDVVDVDGARVGVVADLVLRPHRTADGRGMSLTGTALVVAEKPHPRLLGFDRELRPAVFRLLVRRWAGRVVVAPWDRVSAVDDGIVRLDCRAGELEERSFR